VRFKEIADDALLVEIYAYLSMMISRLGPTKPN